MRKTIILGILFALLCPAFATTPIKPSKTQLKASEIFLPLGKNGGTISLEELAYIKPREFARVTNRKMNLFDRAAFSISQRKLRNSINPDGTINNKKMNRLVAAMDGDTGFHLGGFALGFFLGLIGLLIAYIIDDDFKSNRRKWAWIGFGSFLVIYLIIVLATI